jgi:ribonucleoside-diphosphate reductase alpha chain
MTKYDYNEAKKDSINYFNGNELAATVFLDKYALKDQDGNLKEKTPKEMHQRIAKEFARIQKKKYGEKGMKEDEIFDLLDEFKYVVPQGSPMFGIGNPYQTVSISNCYVIPTPLDSYGSIMQADESIVQLSKRRGGCGLDISNLRPNGSITHNSAHTSTGIIPFMERFSNSTREVGQCLKGDSLILTKRGLIKISEIKKGEDYAWTKNGWIKIINLYENRGKQFYEITSKYGYKLNASKDHILQSFDNNGNLTEEKIENLSVGSNIVLCIGEKSEVKDYIKLERIDNYKNSNNKPLNAVTPNYLDEKLAYILGYAYGDGYVDIGRLGDSTALSLACCNDYPEIKEKIKFYCKELFGYDINFKNGDGNLEILSINNKYVITFLKENGLLKQKADSLTFPEKIFISSSSVQGAFLSGYFDADGYASGYKKGYAYASINRKFLLDCQKVLMSNSIVSKIHKEDRKNLGWNDLYNLCIVGRISQLAAINFLSQSVKVNLSKFVAKSDFILTPFRSKSFKISYNKYNYCPTNDYFLSLNCINRLKNDGIDCITNLIQDKIISIKESTFEESYDLELESEHLFWCDGYYVHNCNRRGALMLTLSCHHPQIIDFISVKRDLKKVTGANISVKLTDEFLNAVRNNTDYELRFPVDSREKGYDPQISKTISARSVWDKIIENAHAMAEPGILFWDNITKESPSDSYASLGFKTECTNPCSELPLSAADACRLLAINLFSFIDNPFTKNAKFNFNKFYDISYKAQLLMDDLVDIELECLTKIIQKIKSDPEPIDIKRNELELWERVYSKCQQGRRTGLGVTALGDTIAALGVGYGTEESIDITEKIYKELKHGSYAASIDMAEKLGAFSVYNYELEKDQPFLNRIWNEYPELVEKYKKYGRRNIANLTTAPTGSISLLCKIINHFGTSSGIEPEFQIEYMRKKKITGDSKDIIADSIDANGDKWQHFIIHPAAIDDWMEVTGEKDIKRSPWHGYCAQEINWVNRVKLQAAAQRHVDHSISSTVNLPNDVTVEEVKKIFEAAWQSGLKGITIYRDGCREGVLTKIDNKKTSDKIIKTNAPKRPKSLNADLYQLVYKYQKYYVVVGLYNGDKEPYEIFTGVNSDSNGDPIFPKNLDKGYVEKIKRGIYNFKADNREYPLSNINPDESVDALTRMISISLRHGADISFIVQQLEKTKGGLQCFAKVLARTLKKYIKDGSEVHGESCGECGGKLIRQDGCAKCSSCGWSKCG